MDGGNQHSLLLPDLAVVTQGAREEAHHRHRVSPTKRYAPWCIEDQAEKVVSRNLAN